MTKEQSFQVGIKALITNDGDEVLVLDTGGWHLKNQNRHWDIPGGRIQEGYGILDTLAREIEEEIGIKKTAAAKLFTAVPANFPGLMLLVYKMKIPDGSKIKLSPEHVAYEWVSKKEAAKRLSYKYPAEFTDLLK